MLTALISFDGDGVGGAMGGVVHTLPSTLSNMACISKQYYML